jgi:2-polyprenyl-3-methyl-5-hydroxy-6-metoxy-1,4-benzoquinol methylase
MISLPHWYKEFVQEVLGYSLSAGNLTSRLVPQVTKLSEYLRDYRTRTEGPAFNYLQHPLARNAYFTYFTTVNAPKLFRPLDELERGGFFTRESISVLDLGCGTGTGYVGLASWLEEMGMDADNIHYTGVDLLRENLKFTSKLHPALQRASGMRFGSFTTNTLDLTGRQKHQGKFDLVILMNVLNEIHPSKHKALLESLEGYLTDGGYVLMIEPALRESSRGLLYFRDIMTADDWTIYSPCFRQKECPALRSVRDWCHTEDLWQRPAFIEAIDKQVGLVKLSLKYSYIIANRNGDTLSKAMNHPLPLHRSVSETFKEKGRTRVFLCGDNGRHQYLFNHKDKTKGNRAIQKVSRYDIVGVTKVKRRARDVLIRADSLVERVKKGH